MKVILCCMIGLAVVAGCKDSDQKSASVTVPPGLYQAGNGVGTGRLPAGKDGVVVLPENLKGATADGKAYVKKVDQTQWVLLVEKMDSPKSFTGWAFIRTPPAEMPATLDLLGPGDGDKPAAVTVKVEKGIGDGWYMVSLGK